MSTKPAQHITARGPLSAWLVSSSPLAVAPKVDPKHGLSDDLQLALYLCYELHYRDVEGMRTENEWDPDVIRFRQQLEKAWLKSLRRLVEPVDAFRPLAEVIPQMIDADDGPSLSRHMEAHGTLHEMAEFLKHRSAYQLKEADPHTFGIPHLHGRTKQLLAEIQAGEYGADAPDRMMHSALFAQTMRSLDLDDRPNAYLDELPASALMISNLVSMFALNRAYRGCLIGHLAVFEMTSVVPMGRYSRGLLRMGAPEDARRFYDVHVLADAEHERLALQMATCLEADEPHLRDDIIFGSQCVLATERLFAERLFANWSAARDRAISPAA